MRHLLPTKSILAAAIVAALLPLAGLTAGCVVHEHDRRPRVVREEVIVEEAPPPVRVEVRPARPGPDHVWIEGHWVRVGHHWDWVGGHWERIPHERAVWAPGRWEPRSHGYVWIEGHWER